MKKVLLSTAFLLAVIDLGAQNIRLGVNAGTDLLWYTESSGFIHNSNPKAGAIIGGNVSYALNKHWRINSGLNLLFTSAKFDGETKVYSGPIRFVAYKDVEAKTLALEIPLTIGYDFSLSETLKLQPSVGVYGRYGVVSFKGDVYNVRAERTETWKPYEGSRYPSADNIDKLGNMRRWDYGVNAGLLLAAGEHYTISADYMHGFIDQLVKYGMKNNSLRFTLGYTF